MFKREGLTTQEQIEAMYQELDEAENNKLSARIYIKKAIKKVYSLIFTGILILLIFVLANILIQKEKGEIPNVFGYYLFTIESSSMEPTFMVGDIILARKHNGESLISDNTVVTYYDTKGRVVTHRVIDTGQTDDGEIGYVTKGDNPINDPDPDLLTEDRVIAEFIIKIPLS